MTTPSTPDATQHAAHSTGPRLGLAVCATVWIITVAFLGGPRSLLPMLLFVAGLLLPMAALIADAFRGTGLSDEMRVCTGGAFALVACIPLYYLRRHLPVPELASDVLLLSAAIGTSVYTSALQRFCRAAYSPAFRAAGWLVAGLVPGLACLVWLGFEVRSDSSVGYCGLFPIDFSNLAGMVSLIKASPGAPRFVTVGGPALHYHWWFFTVPAFLTEIGGLGVRTTAALALCNCVAAVLLAATLCAAVGGCLRGRFELSEERERSLAAWTAATVIVAPFTVYAYQFVVRHLRLSWFTIGDRNSLMLSIVNSMSTFGNNTLALTLVLLIVAALAASQRHASLRLALLCGFAGTAILGLSVTLAFPLALAAGAWLLLRRVQRPARLVAVTCAIGLAGLPILRATNILGDSSQHLKLAFDGGQFIQNVAFSMLPLWVLAAAGTSVRRELSFAWLLVAADLIVPSLLTLVGEGAVTSTMSMKMASLLPIAAAPLVADGLFALTLTPSTAQRSWLRVAAVPVLLAGLANSSVYTLQFAFYRLTGRTGRCAELPLDYVSALEYVRANTPQNAIVVDPNGDLLPDTVGTLLIAERRVWLPTRYSVEQFRADVGHPEILARPELWRVWEHGGFADEALAKQIADRSDALVGPPGIRSNAWEERQRIGAYAVYASRARAKP